MKRKLLKEKGEVWWPKAGEKGEEYDDTDTWGGEKHKYGDTPSKLIDHGPWVGFDEYHYLKDLAKEIGLYLTI